MSWLLLFLSIFLEVCGTTCMKLSAGFSKLVPSILLFVFYISCFIPFTYAIKHIDVSIAYSVWAGLGTTLIALIGVIWFKEPINAIKIVSILFIVIGLIGLNMSGSKG